MRIVVSGTHASGKSTLIADFALRHPEYTVLPDPFDLIDEMWDTPSSVSFAAQLRVSADRLMPVDRPENLIAERGPIDFLAYLLSIDELAGGSVSRQLLIRSTELTREALNHVDLLVALPLTSSDPIAPGIEEFPELQGTMNDMLLDLLGDPKLIGPSTKVAEITGPPDRRLSTLESLASHAREA
ncbi:hypothetical protein [Leucobacter japonicus]|uniref:hypothetical protein n=1 Tax=Leucobacter japonicus TaxID=1461259 RepID=UPI0006A7A7FC|nr:hypothetical protein [Leucobacter japonicus]